MIYAEKKKKDTATSIQAVYPLFAGTLQIMKSYRIIMTAGSV